MSIQRVALLFGVIFTALAILGFMGTGVGMPEMHGNMDSMPLVLGLFPVNVAHNGVHLLFGAWALAASRNAKASMLFAMVSGAVYLVLAGLGIYAPNGFGLVPLGGYDILLHVGIAVVLVGCALMEAIRPSPAGADAR